MHKRTYRLVVDVAVLRDRRRVDLEDLQPTTLVRKRNLDLRAVQCVHVCVRICACAHARLAPSDRVGPAGAAQGREHQGGWSP